VLRRYVVRAENQRFAVADVPRLPQTGIRGAAIIASAVLAIVVDQTSSAIASAGLPYLSGIVDASPDEASWILTVFNTAYYAMILMSPWMMARIGRKRLMLGALLGFAGVSAVLAGVSDYHAFVALRFVQGAFLGCIYVPAALLFFTSLPTRFLRYAPPIFVLLSLSAATFGTVIGASVAERFGGSTIFVPGAIATLATALAIVLTVRAKDAPQRALVFDRIGLALSLAAFGALQFLANEGERRNWFDDPTVLFAAIVLAIALPAFVIYESTFTRFPHVDFRMFATYRNLAIGGIISVTIGFVGYAVTLYIGYVQSILGATPAEAGAAVLVRVLTYAVGVPLAFALIMRKIVDLRIVVA
jgi:DHA2 family multidrug resistance protein